MSLIGTIIGAAIAGGIAARVSTKRKEKKTKEKEELKAAIPPSTKKEFEKNALDMMEDMAYRQELKRFSLVEAKADFTKYQYLKNGFLFTVKLGGEDDVRCEVKKDNEVILYYVYDKDWGEYDKKTLSRSLIEGKDREKAMKIVNDFMDEVNYYHWDDIEEEFEIFDDIQSLEPIETGEDEAEIHTLDKLEKIERLIQKENMPEEITSKVSHIISQIRQSKDEIAKLDVESQHVFDELIQDDLYNLFTLYIKVEEENREAFKEKILEGLERIQGKTDDLMTRIQGKNHAEVERQLHLIKERYKEE